MFKLSVKKISIFSSHSSQLLGLPLDPALGRMLFWSLKLGCAKEVLIIVSMLAPEYGPFYTPYVFSFEFLLNFYDYLLKS